MGTYLEEVDDGEKDDDESLESTWALIRIHRNFKFVAKCT